MAGLQAGTADRSTCPPEGGHYMNPNTVVTQTLQSVRGGPYKEEAP